MPSIYERLLDASVIHDRGTYRGIIFKLSPYFAAKVSQPEEVEPVVIEPFFIATYQNHADKKPVEILYRLDLGTGKFQIYGDSYGQLNDDILNYAREVFGYQSK